MPPEDLKEKGKVRTKGSDIWALGILIWQIHTAREPYQLDVVKDPNDLYGTETISLKELAKQIINDDKKKPANIDEDERVGHFFRYLINQCWDRNTKTRITINQIVEMLDGQINK